MTAGVITARGYARILVALDSTADGRAGVAAASEMASENGMLTLLGSVRPPHPLVAYSGHVPVALLHEAEHECEGRLLSAASLVPVHLGVRTVLKHGSFDRVLAAEARERPYDLIVIVSHGSSRLAAARCGRRWARVARTGPTPVLIVKEGRS